MHTSKRKVALIGFGLLHLTCDVAALCCPEAFPIHVAALAITAACLVLELTSD
jgi:hypothetical protein